MWNLCIHKVFVWFRRRLFYPGGTSRMADGLLERLDREQSIHPISNTEADSWRGIILQTYIHAYIQI